MLFPCIKIYHNQKLKLIYRNTFIKEMTRDLRITLHISFKKLTQELLKI